MSEQAKTSRWQEWRLRLRALQGWGCDVPELRQWARFYARGVRILPTFMVVELALSLVIFAVLPGIGIGVAPSEPVPFAVRLSLPLLVIALLLMVVFGYLNVRHSVRAEAGAHQPLATHSGSCFATVLASPQLFALIGMTREQAQWFCLPIEWDTAVAPGSDRYELTYTPASGYVARLRRIGAAPRELRQRTVDAMGEGEGESTETEATDGEATPAQRRELKRGFRRAGITWGVAASSLLSTGLSIVCSGASVLAAIVFVSVMLLRYPQPHTRPADPLSVAMFCAMFGLLGVGLLIWGARTLWISAQRRRADAEPPLVIEGEQIRWTPYHDMYGARGDSLALVRLDDGSQRIYRIPAQWTHRLWNGHRRVRVTYSAGTGHVLDYRAVDSSPDQSIGLT